MVPKTAEQVKPVSEPWRQLRWLPVRWRPYAELMRLSKPIGVIIINFPYVYGSLFAACTSPTPPSSAELLYVNLRLLFGTFLLRSWACAWNDIMDRDLDRLVERCRSRPMARGAVSLQAGIIFTLAQMTGWLMYMSRVCPGFGQYIVPLAMLSLVYPYSKRITNHTPEVLGITFAWGTFVGCASTALDPFALLRNSHLGSGVLPLFAYYVVWTVIFETVYAFQDLEDDTKADIKSMAVRFRHNIKTLLTVASLVQLVLIVMVGRQINAGVPYYFGMFGGNAGMLGWLLLRVKVHDPKDCAWWFGKGTLIVGILSTFGLIGEYARRLL